jgi:SAM-dependent methyltransferase
LEIGGHNPEYDVLDDHELLVRTYLKTKIKFIDEVLYIYRITGENTWIERNAKIQSDTVNIYNQYAYQLAERWAELEGLEKIDLGGGFDSPAGYKSIDLLNADIIADLSKGIPLPDNSVGVVRAHDFLEHIADKQFIMSEIYRVLADGGWLLASTPSTDGRGAFQDPTHISYWNDNAFWYWTRQDQAKYIHNDKIKFQEFRLETIFPTEWHKQNNICYTIANLAAIKSDKRRPHLKLI